MPNVEIMTSEDSSDHEEPGPAARWYVPVRSGPGSDGAWCVLRLFRTPHGETTAVAFTSLRRLAAVLGSGQEHVHLSEYALRDLTKPLGIELITLDPIFSGPADAAPAAQTAAAASASSDAGERELVPALAGGHRG